VTLLLASLALAETPETATPSREFASCAPQARLMRFCPSTVVVVWKQYQPFGFWSS
jgi:hypothetical protein